MKYRSPGYTLSPETEAELLMIRAKHQALEQELRTRRLFGVYFLTGYVLGSLALIAGVL